MIKISKRILSGFIAVFLALTVVLLLPVNTTHAALPFGGKVLNTRFCACPVFPGFSITVGAPKGGLYFWSLYSTIPYSFYFPRKGDVMKGTATTETGCWQPSNTGCTYTGPGGLLIREFGDSLKSVK